MECFLPIPLDLSHVSWWKWLDELSVYHNQVDQLENRLPIGEGDDISQESSHRGKRRSHKWKAFGNVFYSSLMVKILPGSDKTDAAESSLAVTSLPTSCGLLRTANSCRFLIPSQLDFNAILKPTGNAFYWCLAMSMLLPDGHVTLSENPTVTAVPTA